MAEVMASQICKNVLAWRGCEKLYLDSRTSDVSFMFESNCGKIETVPAHKNILSSISPVFDAMFYGPVKQEGDVNIVDSSPEAFTEFLQFFYLSSVTLTSDNVAEVMNLGKKYELNDCFRECTNLCKSTLTLDNMCWGYELAILFEDDELKQFCEERISNNSEEIFRSNSFLKCDSNLLRHILKLNSLNCKETVVFDGCVNWAKEACIRNGLDEQDLGNVRSQLGDLFYEIRFRDINIKDFFVLYALHDKLFSLDELKELGQTTDVEKRGKFNSEPRKLYKQLENSKLLICDRTKGVSPVVTVKSWNITTFSTTHPLLLTEIVCPKVFRGDECVSFIPAAFEILRETYPISPISSETTDLHSEDVLLFPTHDAVVKLTTPINIEPDILYKIVFFFENDHYKYHFMSYKREVEIGEICIQFYEDSRTTDYTNSYGLVKRLHFLKIDG